MRDILVTVLILGSIPWILKRPYIGVLVYAVLSLMNPHRLTFGFAYTFPFAMVIALTTLVAMVISREKKHVPWSGTFVVWLLFVLWMNITTLFALVPEEAILEWDRTMKIQLMVLVAMLLIHGQQRINALVWVIVASLGFYGLKGGLFTVLTGGAYRVMGPWDTFITDNNTLALALIMMLPLMRYLLHEAKNAYVRMGLLGGMLLTAMSILSSHSRGALLAGGAIVVFLMFKSKYKLRFLLGAICVLPIMLLSMPEAWWERMASIKEYDQDPSAMGRINAWWFAFNIAKDNPLTGGGYRVFTEDLFEQFAPNPVAFHDAHSIYFEVLGEQGFVGLGLFLLLGLLSFLTCAWIIRNAREREDLEWAANLARMLQVSLVGYGTGGAFLGLAYYDLPYYLISIVVVLQFHVRRQLAVEPTVESTDAQTDDTDAGAHLQRPKEAP